MVYVNQYCLDTFACLELDANLLMLINGTWLINMLNSTLISLVESSHSCFALVVFCVQVRSCFLLLAMPMRVVSGKSKPMRVGLCTGILRLSVPMDGILF
jgi:hypothetical protein